MTETIKSIEWTGDRLVVLDHTMLPKREVYVTCLTYQDVIDVIKTMKLRGAPLIGVAAAFGIVLAAKTYEPGEEFLPSIMKACEEIVIARPTAVNLRWAVERMKKAMSTTNTIDKIIKSLEEEAIKIYNEDREINKKIGKNGNELIPENAKILTHCNAGALATAGYGTALGVIRAAREKNISVLACETRPYLQGARLTTFELALDKIDVTLITDNMAGFFIKDKKVDIIIVGADRIAKNGDVANKIGTFTLAVLAEKHSIPFYVAAPTSTIDPTCSSGNDIPIEYRNAEEVKKFMGFWIAPQEVKALHPAFDITPAELVTAIITENGIYKKPYEF